MSEPRLESPRPLRIAFIVACFVALVWAPRFAPLFYCLSHVDVRFEQ